MPKTKKIEKAKEPKRRKPAELRKESQLHLRVTEDQKGAFERAAEREGLDVAAWARSVLLKAAGEVPAKDH